MNYDDCADSDREMNRTAEARKRAQIKWTHSHFAIKNISLQEGGRVLHRWGGRYGQLKVVGDKSSDELLHNHGENTEIEGRKT